ncbi:MAG: hypothetical protein JWQ99_3267 [Blastococcus sp.]|jgi:hypothetical protein|nr:hypothetical protein [Blastococcus sp.]
MKDVADFFTSVHGFFMSAGGSGLITWILAYPAHRETLVNGHWTTCGGSITDPPCSFASLRVTNHLGMDALANYSSTATIAAVLIGLIFAGAAAGFASLAQPRA